MTPSWPAAPPLASCVTSTGHSTSLGFRHLPNKKAGPPSKGGANRDPVGPWRPLAGSCPGSALDGKAATCDAQVPVVEDSLWPELHISSHSILAGAASGFPERSPHTSTWLPPTLRCWLFHFTALEARSWVYNSSPPHCRACAQPVSYTPLGDKS